MPRYYFNLLFGDRVSQDEEGVELRDHAAAREEAFATIRELSDPAVGGNPRRWAGWFLQVADARSVLLRAPIGHPALELVSKDTPRSERIASTPRRAEARKVPTASGKRLAELIRERLAHTRRTAALLRQNHRLRQELLALRTETRLLMDGVQDRRLAK